jgi:hypothetical protein
MESLLDHERFFLKEGNNQFVIVRVSIIGKTLSLSKIGNSWIIIDHQGEEK